MINLILGTRLVIIFPSTALYIYVFNKMRNTSHKNTLYNFYVNLVMCFFNGVDQSQCPT